MMHHCMVVTIDLYLELRGFFFFFSEPKIYGTASFIQVSYTNHRIDAGKRQVQSGR
jgi:hypothetical protein